ncbi:hypothetical protein GCM10010345_89600 [Streptomyces canarius]|uniref:Uncharacterized protein n=1 Tax=Streptomyces canarius TaxID=285453 RepID=A0ABQ3DB78_9ACTN|nr:hypothetical protein GCM10010345_89600 [Streptomyces canarius]
MGCELFHQVRAAQSQQFPVHVAGVFRSDAPRAIGVGQAPGIKVGTGFASVWATVDANRTTTASSPWGW